MLSYNIVFSEVRECTVHCLLFCYGIYVHAIRKNFLSLSKCGCAPRNCSHTLYEIFSAYFLNSVLYGIP